MAKSDLVDLTLPLKDGMQLFPGLPRFESESRVADETGALTRLFTSSTHQGTHVDAPAHYTNGSTLDNLSLNLWTGEAQVVDLREHRGNPITAEVLDANTGTVGAGDRMILLTGDVDLRFGDKHFFEEAATLTAGGAEWLVQRNVSLVANDFLTESLDDPARPVHHSLLGAGIPIVEYLCNVSPIVDAHSVEFICFPLRLPGFEASPVRAVARR